MEKIYILCVEDQREVLNTISSQLAEFEKHVIVEECESAGEAEELIEEIDAKGDFVAIVISDHVMPGKSGVELLTTLHQDDRFKDTKKILLTGQATHMDTIKAINMAGIDYYIEKPWKADDLIKKTSSLLTQYVVKKGLNYESYVDILDSEKLFNLLKL
ncbi:response regulator [Reichenbachiella ulvae]|uniref:Response regulator n=1 Tax=Reichenbachiella ulvae TaxID=2980104 RepID=A0ABT3CTE5_9BACT|nr:response regulator [Reichenbachiella ulvae]MCV9386872.1 response regulator [Reichenbachiella ulvae]